MAPTEYVIAEAKRRSSSVCDRPRASTTVDDNGCIVQRGFMIPSRSSSFDSGSSTFSSAPEDPGTPASPIADAPPGFKRSACASHHVFQLDKLLADSTRHSGCSSLADSILGGRLPLQRRHTVQDYIPSCRWEDEELESVKCVQGSSGQNPHLVPFHTIAPMTNQSKNMRRTNSEQIDLNRQLCCSGRDAAQKVSDREARKKYPAKRIEISEKTEAENAIASDSEEEDGPAMLRPGQAVLPFRQPTYAERRSRRDSVAAHLFPMKQELASPVYQSQALPLRSTGKKPSTPIPNHEKVHKVLARELAPSIRRTASTHHHLEISDTNAKASNHPACPIIPTARRQPPPLPLLRALAIPSPASAAATLRTPTEVRSFNRDSPLATSWLAPSCMRPGPPKGVLKKAGSSRSVDHSPRATKYVLTTLRRSNTSDGARGG